ncbi:hypothetical protein G9A89_010401 [Geosiphon pyriformis]|nr:hypothetical protein G9A89_010401 [Geosiphon pyriformis]
MRQDTTQATPFELVYGRIATLSVERKKTDNEKQLITFKSLKKRKKNDTITNYQINQLNSRLETKYFYIIPKQKNNGMENLIPNGMDHFT